MDWHKLCDACRGASILVSSHESFVLRKGKVEQEETTGKSKQRSQCQWKYKKCLEKS